ncbi:MULTISPECIES: chromate transporter [Turicibacter]|uniref:Chromate transporter n=1 Tax=Turicibacter sanguinis TaxID=154288 RepID=A0A6G2CRK7_9FIRM|nr:MULTISPECIES: chromate transporter [Turicibacter]MBP3903865.1 chromate transporter [Turicibacter sp.]MDB8437665.1 chromate transporter [Turicibacter sanguinis]MDB8459658.1 chromate transporter [Turicibacter sanguinis]MDB8563278.1 chromate transporter [Turicibacter sanguinis]MTK68508.1 chromate transporter [Turicibacter sanguinis]
MIYLKLFLSFFQIGLFSFGGGYAALPLIEEQVVVQNGWLSMTGFTDIITISQMTPGPIVINAATFVGMQIAGLLGAIIATMGCVSPSCIIVLTLAFLYQRYKELPIIKGILFGLRPAVVALIASAGVSIICLSFFGEEIWPPNLNHLQVVSVILFILSLIGLRKFKLNPITVMLIAGGISVILQFI